MKALFSRKVRRGSLRFRRKSFNRLQMAWMSSTLLRRGTVFTLRNFSFSSLTVRSQPETRYRPVWGQEDTFAQELTDDLAQIAHPFSAWDDSYLSQPSLLNLIYAVDNDGGDHRRRLGHEISQHTLQKEHPVTTEKHACEQLPQTRELGPRAHS